jgi:hypothetical protein
MDYAEHLFAELLLWRGRKVGDVNSTLIAIVLLRDGVDSRCELRAVDTIGYMSAGLAKLWKLRREFLSHRYRTDCNELLRA